MRGEATAFSRTDFGRRRFGELLVRAGLVTEEQFEAAWQEQALGGGRLNDILIDRGLLSEDSLAQALMTELGLAAADTSIEVEADLLALVPREFAETHLVVPLAFIRGRTLVVGASDPLNFAMIDWLRARTGCYIEPRVATPTALRQTIERLYGKAAAAQPLPSGTPDVGLPQPRVIRMRPEGRLRSVPNTEDVREPRDAADLAREVKALRAVVQLLVDKGLLSQDEISTCLR